MPNLNLFAHPATLRRIDPPHLIAWLAPWRTYLARRHFNLPSDAGSGPVDYAGLAAVFMEPDAAMPRALMHSAALIHEMRNETAKKVLLAGAEARGVSLDLGGEANPDPVNVAVQLWLKQPDLLEELHRRHELERPRVFVHFATGRDPVPVYQPPSAAQQQQLEAALSEAFLQARRGREARLFAYPRPPEYWFLLQHGLSCRRQEVLTETGTDTLLCRPCKYDVLVYNAALGELHIHGCNASEVELLRRQFGRYLFGDPEFFPGSAKFTLAPLVLQRRACLACGDIPGIEQVTLTEVQALSGGKDELRITYQAPDLFDAVERQDIVLPPPERLVRATLLVRFSDSQKERTARIIGSNRLCVVRDSDTGLLERLLQAREFILPTCSGRGSRLSLPPAIPPRVENAYAYAE